MRLRRDWTPAFLFAGAASLCWLFVMHLGVYGSRVDWISQHSVIPDYFRRLFYESGDLFPNFAPNLGGGQNIYHYSYYGLFNPVILFSYLLPFVKMSDYVMASSICCYGISVALFYLWIRRKCENRIEAVAISAMFALAGPLVYHFYNQLMFVNYMPFLCLALMGTDRYLDVECAGKRSGLLIAGTFGMIMTSFYFSIGGILALCLYGSSEYLKRTRQANMLGFLKCAGGFVLRILIAVMTSGILLVPTVFGLGVGRGEKMHASLSWLVPHLKTLRILYSPYGLGLSAFALAVLLSGMFYRTWKERLLSLELMVLLGIPAFGYFLNGGLYDKDKVWIPFLPLLCYLVIPYLKEVKYRVERRSFYRYIPYVLVPVLLVISRNEGGFSKYWIPALVDALVLFFLFCLCCRKKIWWLLPVSSCVVLGISGWLINDLSEMAVPRSFYEQVTSDGYASLLAQLGEGELQGFRTEQLGDAEENKANINRVHSVEQNISIIYSSAYNGLYEEFRKNVFQLDEPFRNDMMQGVTENPFFLRFMGIKYLLSEDAPAGYRQKTEGAGAQAWGNDAALPMIYATNQVITKAAYEKVSFPQNQTALLQAAVVESPLADEGNAADKVKPVMEQTTFVLPEMKNDNLQIKKIEHGYEIHANESTSIDAKLEGEESVEFPADLFALSFAVENENVNEDMCITLEKQSNKLTDARNPYANQNNIFTYLISLEQGQSVLHMTFGAGDYQISDVKAYTGAIQDLDHTGLCQKTFAYSDQRKGDIIRGHIVTETDGYLITSIPFDKGFTILADGKEVQAEVVNTAFLGCRLSGGDHEIVITYHAPGSRLGAGLSLTGLLVWIFLIFENFSKNKYVCFWN
ncbi:MAG: YfhO family protein [Lachnospiraceae bacterium]|nr:YfhO family protein [Lachnospiraceae bacterium]